MLAPERVLGGRYRLRRELARGGMATVWEAEDRVLNRRVAIKVLHPHLAGDDGFRMRFRREAVAAAGLAHPHIVTTYDTGRDSDVAYIVMELVLGITLARLLREGGTLPAATAVDIAVQVADALACAHEHGIIHRDVKPANILLRSDGHVKVADFGIAKAGAGNDLTRTGVVMGTAKYLSPEQVSGNPAEAGSDLYALGIVLYEMLAGHPPFVGDTELSTAVARLTATPESLRERRPDIPRSLEAVVLRSLARDPEVRFRSAAEMRASLLAVDLTGEDSLTPPAGIAIAARPERHFPARAVTAAAVVLLLIASAVLLAGGGNSTGNDGRRTEAGREASAPVTTPKPGSVPLAVASFDPEGDGEENQANVGLLTDSNQATSWKSDSYRGSDFGRLKSGVGITVDLGSKKTVRSVEIDSSHPGWVARIFVGDRSAPDIAGWGDPVAEGSGSFQLTSATGRYLLVWFTSVPPGTDGGYRIDVAELRVKT